MNLKLGKVHKRFRYLNVNFDYTHLPKILRLFCLHSILILFLTLLTTHCFSAPGMRTYTRADVDNEKVKVNVEEEISQPVSQPENDNSQKLLVQENIEDNVEDRLKNSINKKPYETEQFIVANITSIKNTQVANSQKNPTNLNTKQDIEKSRSGLKEIRERVLSNPDRIPVSEEDILMAKRRIIEKHGLNVPLIE